MKKAYYKPNALVELLEEEDVLTASPDTIEDVDEGEDADNWFD